MMIARHGGNSHYVRPDRVYKTGVLAPIGGFVPQQDVMAVARQFTLGPYAFMDGQPTPVPGQGVAGPSVRLMGPPVQLMGWWPPSSWGWLAQLRARIAAWKAQRAATKAAKAAGVSGLGFAPMGPIDWAGGRAVPMPGQRVAMLIAMQQKNQPPAIAMQNSAAIAQRWNYMRAPSR